MAYDDVAGALGSDVGAAVLKSVGRAEPRQWLRAQARQRDAPQRGRPSLDRLSEQQLADLASSQTGLFVPRGGTSAVSVEAARNPAPNTSFGFVDVFATVDAKVDFLDGFVVLKTDLRLLSHIQPESLRLFRWDPKGRRFTIVPRSAVGPKGAYVSARISQRGLYAIVGLHVLPEVVETVRLICGLSDRARRLPAAERKQLKDRVCEKILCARDGRGDLPGGQLGINPCETCTGLSDTEWFNLPECQILAERPCVDGRWTAMGPLEITGSQNRSFNRGIGCAKNIAIDESDHRRVYATGEHGGVWVLSRADQWPQSRWAPIGDALEGLQMRAIAIAPSEPKRLYVGNAFGFIYVSRNRGSSWTRTGDTDLGFIRRILVDRTLQQTLFVATNSGLHRSADSGGTWTQLLEPGLFPVPDVLDAVMDPDDSTVLYMGVRRQGVFKSSDSGQSWTLVLPFSDALSQANEMIRLSLGLRHAGGTSQSDLDRTVAVKFGREVLINNDGGRSSFVSKGARGGNGGSRRRSDGGRFSGEWCNILAVDPNNPTLVLAGQEDLFKTTDAGATWRSIMPDRPGTAGRLTHEDFQDVCFDAQKPGVAYLACDGGVYLYVDARVDDPDGDLDAEQFEERNNGLAVSEFFRVSVHGSLAIGNLDHNGLKATTDVASKTWQHVPVGNNALETHSVYADPKRTGRFYTVNIDSAGGSLKRLRFPTVDAPTDLLVFAPFVPYFSDVSSLTEVSQFASLPMSPIAVDVRAGSNVMLACAHRSSTEGFRLMLTYEAHREPTVDAAGNSTFLPAWEVAYDNGRQDPIVSVTFAPSAPGTAYAISAAGRVVSTADVTAGAADDGWDVRGPWPQTDVRQIAVNAQFPERIYAVSGQAFGRSSDGGRQWAIADVTSPQGRELNSLAVHPHDPHTLFVGADTGVFISYDEGARWAPYDVGLPNAEVTQIQTDGPYLYAVTHGRGLWRRRYC